MSENIEQQCEEEGDLNLPTALLESHSVEKEEVQTQDGIDTLSCNVKDKIEKKRKLRGIEGSSLADVTSGSSSGISGSDVSRASVHSDMCRICHMGSSPCSSTENNPSCSSSTSQQSLGLLVSACRCRGTVGLVHTKCLERWLTESGHTRCEICGYKYATVRVPRYGRLQSFLLWFRSFVASRQMLLDSLYLVVTTPLAFFSAYVCAMTLKLALENRFTDIPWTIVAMLPTCTLTLVAYWGWLLTLRRLHGRRWRQYWQSNFIIRLVPDSPIEQEQATNTSVEDFNLRQDELYDDFLHLFDVL